MRADNLQEYKELLVSLAEAASPVQHRKEERTWHGNAVIPIERTAEDYLPGGVFRNDRWTIRLVEYRPAAFIHVEAWYRARGANANDAERYLAALFGVDRTDVKIATVTA
jgi:hypothetical protein